jgi:hypothetical protein
LGRFATGKSWYVDTRPRLLWATADLSIRSSYPRPGTEPRTSWKTKLLQTAALVEGSTHDGTADSIHGLKLYGHRMGDESAQTTKPSSHVASATSNNKDTNLTPHRQNPPLERTSWNEIITESSAFPKKPRDKANGDLGGCPREDDQASVAARKCKQTQILYALIHQGQFRPHEQSSGPKASCESQSSRVVKRVRYQALH